MSSLHADTADAGRIAVVMKGGPGRAAGPLHPTSRSAGRSFLWTTGGARRSEAIRQAHRAGIRITMITGDHPLTAARIAAALGITELARPYPC